jgi:phosphate transport system substrate-binding protein
MNLRHALGLFVVAALCAPLVGCSRGDGVTIQGSGATFPAPLYKRWFLEYYRKDPATRVNYQAIGSGAGIRQFTEGLVGFAASDAAMNDQEIALFRKQRGADVQLLPMTAGSVVLAYNVEGVSQPIRLSRRAYLGIFLDRIRRWDHPDIKSANPGLDLPSTPIKVVRRAEGSGTTYAFTNHLSAVGKAVGEKWTPGVSKASDNWPGRTVGGRGNDGVAALIQQIPGSIGYLEFGYAKLAELPAAVLENRSGAYVAPTPESSLAALKIPRDFKIPEQFRIWLPDPPGRMPTRSSPTPGCFVTRITGTTHVTPGSRTPSGRSSATA